MQNGEKAKSTTKKIVTEQATITRNTTVTTNISSADLAHILRQAPIINPPAQPAAAPFTAPQQTYFHSDPRTFSQPQQAQPEYEEFPLNNVNQSYNTNRTQVHTHLTLNQASRAAPTVACSASGHPTTGYPPANGPTN